MKLFRTELNHNHVYLILRNQQRGGRADYDEPTTFLLQEPIALWLNECAGNVMIASKGNIPFLYFSSSEDAIKFKLSWNVNEVEFVEVDETRIKIWCHKIWGHDEKES